MEMIYKGVKPMNVCERQTNMKKTDTNKYVKEKSTWETRKSIWNTSKAFCQTRIYAKDKDIHVHVSYIQECMLSANVSCLEYTITGTKLFLSNGV